LADEEEAQQSQLVVVGSSAGGVDALSTLVATLPRDFPAPIVIAQHLEPHRPSHLAPILSNRSTLPIQLVTDTAALTPGVIFLVPSNHHVEITDHGVKVIEAGESAPRPSIDHLFESAAESFGEGLIAVILTGTGSDGTAGARQVKALGGTVVIQNPATAAFPEMPQSLAPTIVDIVAELESIGPLLGDLVRGAYETHGPDDDRMLRAFLNDLRDKTGMDFSSYKRPTIMRRLQRRMLATGRTKLRDYVRYVHTTPDEIHKLTSSFLIKVTEFFRDPDLFERLRRQVIPEIVESARRHDNELRIWSAGCATGEEAYSIAILLCEELGEAIDQFNIRIFATDLDPDAVDFARKGIYPPAALANVPVELLRRYFVHTNGDLEIKKNIRALMLFGQHDLAQRAPFPRIDLVLCRNVLIYFTPDLQRRALQLFSFSLRDGGYLVLGKAETTSPKGEHFVLEDSRLKIYRRQGARVLIPPSRFRDAASLGLTHSSGDTRAWITGQVKARRESASEAAAAERAEMVMLHLPVGVVTINRDYDIQSINASARRMLGIHTAAIGSDFVHLAAQLPGQDLRRMIDRAFAGELSTQVFDLGSDDPQDTDGRHLEITCQPQGSDSSSGPAAAVSLVVIDVTGSFRELRDAGAQVAKEKARTEHATLEARRLSEGNRELLRANEDLTSSNAALRSGNQELLIAMEEVQAANEEVETLNEELQATNEELETLNEELQATIEELNTANDDLESRANELQTVASSLEIQRGESEAARARLAAVLDSMPLPVLVVDARARRVLVNPAFERAFPPEIEMEDDEGRPMVGPGSIEARALADPAGSELTFGALGSDGSRARYVARTRPVVAHGELVGAIATFTPCPDAAPCPDGQPSGTAARPERAGSSKAPA
jgi:two-component system CheB/CheR fusion protein